MASELLSLSAMMEASNNGSPHARKGALVWFTGLSGSGKSTLAQAVFKELEAQGRLVEILDGDMVRAHLSKGLGFSREDRMENIRRIAFVGNLLARHGVVVLAPVIAPYRSIREEVRDSSPCYIEVYVNAPLEICEQRDPKGLYRRARAGEIANFTGLDDPYEAPESPEVECRTHVDGVEACVNQILQKIEAALDLPPVSLQPRVAALA